MSVGAQLPAPLLHAMAVAMATGAPRRRRSPPAGAGRRRGGAVPRPGRAGSPGARDEGVGPRSVRTRRAERPQRCGGEPAAAAPVSRGKGAGEHEGLAGKLTTGSNRAEDGRRVEIGVEGGAPAMMAMAAGGLELDSAGVGLNRARGWLEEVKGEARELGARRIRSGQRGDGRHDELCSRRLGVRARKEKRMEGRSFLCSRRIRAVRGGRGSPRCSTRGELAGVQAPVWASGAHSNEHRRRTVIV
jgi:hypothetical protein